MDIYYNFYNYYNYNYNNTNTRKNVILLGDGFFARGFLHTIDSRKFNTFQIYKDSFINPQDMMYSFQRDQIFSRGNHFRDIFYKGKETKLKMEIKTLGLSDENNTVTINNDKLNFDYLIIGLGAQKTLQMWTDELNENVGKRNQNYGIVGMGPIGLELGLIISKFNKVDMFDMLPQQKVLGYVSPIRKEEVLKILKEKDITTTYEKMYDSKNYSHDKTFFCVGTRPNILTQNFKINKYLQTTINPNIYIGGDCINSLEYIKTGQMAYQQGVYVAKRLNKEIGLDEPFEYKSNGIALNVGDKKVLIEGNSIISDGVYPDFIIKLYSMFFV
jgi:NADH dehydrogenase FAD-containing subunit